MENNGNDMFLLNEKVCYAKVLASEIHVFLWKILIFMHATFGEAYFRSMDVVLSFSPVEPWQRPQPGCLRYQVRMLAVLAVYCKYYNKE